ncbi:hypothetical protein DIPPA_09327 [Diplonema papillatum]|nr:hypothetical protein DIPPA_09327 [Diplonema papillatum]
MLRSTRLALCAPQLRIGWGDRLRGVSRQVFGKVRVAQQELAERARLAAAQAIIEPESINAAEKDVRRLYWGEFGDEGAMGGASTSLPDLMIKISRVLVFCVQHDPELRAAAAGGPASLESYPLHKSAVCQSLFLLTVQQAQRMLPPQLLDLLTIEVLTRAQELGCRQPRVLPNDKEAISAIFSEVGDGEEQD